MKIKNILLGVLFGLVGLGAVYAIYTPNILGRPTITSANPNNYYTIIQSGTTQGKISMANFANSISGSLGLSGFLTGFTETDPVRNSVSGNYVGMSMTGNWNTAYSRGNHALAGYPTLTGTINNLAIIGTGGTGLKDSMYASIANLNGIYYNQARSIFCISSNGCSSAYDGRDTYEKDQIIMGKGNKTDEYGGQGLTIIGGGNNTTTRITIENGYSSIFGGESNSITWYSRAANIFGGASNIISYTNSTSLGGGNTIFGGKGNSITKNGGSQLLTTIDNSIILGGNGNKIYGTAETTYSGKNSIIIGGSNNLIRDASYSYALGSGVIISGTINDIFTYNNTGTYNTSVPGSFNINAYGGINLGGAVSCNSTITTTAYILTGGTIPMQIIASGTDMSFQMYSGGVWVEKGKFTW